MQNSYQELARLLTFHPGHRRIPALSCPEALAGAANSLVHARRVVLCSGFYIGRAAAWETDGPLGTLILAATLEQVGIQPIIFTDRGAMGIFDAGMRTLGLQTPLVGFAPGQAAEHECLVQYQPDALIAIERSGQASDGNYYNANGQDVTKQVAHFDPLFTAAPNHGITTIAIGDGGNEIGFGVRIQEVRQLLGASREIACTTPADYLIACGVSNWGGYALAALVAWHNRIRLPIDQKLLLTTLEQIVAAGAIDGVSGQAIPTVDGLPLAVELTMFNRLTNALPSLVTQVVGEN
ncbi:MAG TPA: DUF4392 domain-containing protein [Firmicutes bacterium]|nr:DUF4392 domain-containing protein [Bacillota bacterium]